MHSSGRDPERQLRSWARIGALVAVFLGVSAAALPVPAYADDDQPAPPPIRDLWGEVGILDMPSSRMAPDAEISATLGIMQNTQRYNFDFQVTPWFEATFRYGHISGVNGQVDYHRNLGLKFRLFEETDYTPEISLGARDIIGTGRQGAEYLVGTKAIGAFDITAGVGWGRLAGNEVFPNPFALAFPSFKTRAIAPTTGGTLAFGQLFHGEKMGVFGGIDWKTPIEGLDALVEYSSDKYVTEAGAGVIKPRAPVNFGLSYAIASNLRIMAGWFYGTSYGVTLTYMKDPSRSTPVHVGPVLPPPKVRTDLQQSQALRELLGHGEFEETSESSREVLSQALMSEARGVHNVELEGRTLVIDATYFEQGEAQCASYARIVSASRADVDTVAVSDPNDVSGNVAICDVGVGARKIGFIDARSTIRPDSGAETQIRHDVEDQRLTVVALAASRNELWIYYRNDRYWNETEAAGRVVRILTRDATPEVEIFHVILVQHGLAVREFQIARSAIERAVTVNGQATELGEAVSLQLPDLDQPILNKALKRDEPYFTWAIAPAFRESFFDPKSPIQFQLFVSATADLEVAPGVDLVGEIEGNLYNNYDLTAPSASQLPHVRSNITQYYRHGINGIGNLEGDYRTRLAPDVYSIVRIGYLENMFAGIGGQVLWRPEGQRFAIGVDLYQVWQRNFDRLFGVQHYNILTGHVTVYYNSPWYDLNFNVHVGRYLAGDYGGTIEVTRRFDTGVEIGAFATFTNVPFSKFGEGSFDKGFILRIPFEWTLPFYTKSEHDTILHSLARDGGQRLVDDDSLYYETRSASYGDLLPHIDAITDP